MLKKSWSLLGTVLFWLLWPLIWIYAPLILRCRVLVIAEGKILVVKIWFGPKKWRLPGGGKKMGESELAASIRELYEETGIKVSKVDLNLLIKNKLFALFGIKHRVTIYAVNLKAIPKLNLPSREIVDAKWMTIKQLQAEEIGADVAAALDGIANSNSKMLQ